MKIANGATASLDFMRQGLTTKTGDDRINKNQRTEQIETIGLNLTIRPNIKIFFQSLWQGSFSAGSIA